MTTVSAAALHALGEDACYALLRTAEIGRVVATHSALPLVVPVNFALDGHAVVFRTTSDGTLAAATSGTVVAFEVDDIDRMTRSGWSVVVTGVATAVTDVSDLVRMEQLGIAPWTSGPRNHFVRITPGLVTGRLLPAV